MYHISISINNAGPFWHIHVPRLPLPYSHRRPLISSGRLPQLKCRVDLSMRLRADLLALRVARGKLCLFSGTEVKRGQLHVGRLL